MSIKQNIKEAVVNSNKLARKAYLANIGVYGYAYETAQERFNKVNEDSKQLFEKLVAQGETLESQIIDQGEEIYNKVEACVPENVKEFNSKIRSELDEIRVKVSESFDIPSFTKEAKKQPAKKATARKKPAAKKAAVKKPATKKAA